jgi:glycoside/pentoside/hexuronide:cation symporter, GPH family
MSSAEAEEKLALHVKAGFALGDHSINIQLAAVSLFFLFFLTEIAGLPPSQAGLVLLAGRAVDAITDPLMGRFSDVVRWRWGRRRPFFLLAALPFGFSFALLWSTPDLTDPAAIFLFYVAIYIVNTLFSTLLAVPYMALLPELAVGYQERTSLNAFRTGGVVVAILATAVGMPSLVKAFGGGAGGYAAAGVLLGVWMAVPWFVVYAVSWERPGFRRSDPVGFFVGARRMAGHRAYRRLAALFVAGRIAVDVVGALFLFYFSTWIGRPGDFPIAMGLMLGGVMLSLPIWMRIAAVTDKNRAFIAGALWWVCMLLGLLWVGPESPRSVVFAFCALAGIGYGVADLMPWSMLGDVIDEDEYETGQRRDGVYTGFFTFLRKLGGATGVALAGFALEAAGFERGGGPQSDSAIVAIRLLTTAVPAVFLLVSVAVAWGYPLGRRRHRDILAALETRRRAG